MTNILLASIAGILIGIAYALVKVYSELEYANRLTAAKLKADGIEPPEPN